MVYLILTLLGGSGRFLYGMNTMSSGLRNACGNNLKKILEKATRNKLTSILSGMLITILIQSSSATDVMVIGFVSSGLMTLEQAIGVIIGANIGTTITAQITAFDIEAFTPVLIFIGAVLYIFFKKNSYRSVGTIILGFGILFQGLDLIKTSIEPLGKSPAVMELVSGISNPFLTLLLGIIISAVLQSSSSATVIFQTFASQGIISYDTAVYLVLGTTVGSLSDNMLASLSLNIKGKRAALLNLIFNVIRMVLMFTLVSLFPGIKDLIKSLSPDNVARQIANTHTLFAIFSVLVVMPFTDQIVKLSKLIVPLSESELLQTTSFELQYLLQTEKIPEGLLMDQALLEVSRMGRLACDNLKLAVRSFFEKDTSLIETVKMNEEGIDELSGKIVDKLVDFRQLPLSPSHMQKLYKFIQVVSDFERISDHAENIAEYAALMESGEASMTNIAIKDLNLLSTYTIESMDYSLSLFEKEDTKHIDEAVKLEQRVDDTKEMIINGHIDRLMKESCDPHGGVIFTDMSIDLERCSDHAFNVATALADVA